MSAQAPAQLPDHLHRGLRHQRDQLDPDRGRPVQGHQDQGDAAARREGGQLSGAGQGRCRRRHRRAARDPADQRPGPARALAKDGRLSGEAEVGKTATYTLVVGNDGTAPLEEVELSGTVPSNWKVEFNPKSIASVAPNEKKEVQVAGDAVRQDDRRRLRGLVPRQRRRASRLSPTSASPSRPRPSGASSGIGIIAVALLVLLGAVARFGRR